MKKSTLTLGVIAALGAAWVGGAWYTGKVAEEEFVRQVNLVNKDLQQSADSLGLDIRFDHVSFERGLFSSKTKYDILVAELENPSKTWTLPFEGTLYHGPLPLNQLSHFNFMPSLFSSVDLMTKNETTAPWFEATKGKTPITVTTFVDYNQSGSSHVDLVPFEAVMEDGTLAVNGLDMKLGFKRDGVNKLDFALNKLQYSEPDKNASVEFNDLKIDAEYQRIPEWAYLSTGKQFVSGGAVKITDTDTEGKVNNFGIKDWKMDFNTVRKEKFLDSVAKIVANGFTYNQSEFGDLNIDSAFNHIDGETFNQLMHIFTEAAKQKKEDLSDEEIAAVKKFFNTQPQFIFTPTLTNKKGKLAGNLDFSIANSDFENLLAEGKTFNLFNHFIFKVDVNKEALVEQVATGLQSLSLDKEQATKMAATEVGY